LNGLGVGVAILVMFTPVGWVGALIVGIGTAVGSHVVGKGAGYLYNTYGQKVDIASASGVTHLCR